jgi:hypothetical protein
MQKYKLWSHFNRFLRLITVNSAVNCRRIFLASALLLALVEVPGLHAQVTAKEAANHEKIATNFPGASIVERIQAAILDCGPNPCAVYIPAGTYDASAVSSWHSRNFSGGRVGILLPSNVDLRGAGQNHTIIHITRLATDPPAAFLTNANQPNRNIRIHDMSIVWSDSGSTFDWVTIFLFHGCDQVELDHLTLEGNPNKLVNLLDSTGSSVYDNEFLLRSTSYGHGDNALSFSRFDAGVSAGPEAGVVRDNRFREVGDYGTFSMLLVSQSGLYVHSNLFQGQESGPANATGIESGQDNVGRMPENVKISGNIFRHASIAYGGVNISEISGNFFDHGDIYIAPQSGTTASLSQLTIADNELHSGSIAITGLEHIFSGRCAITNNRVSDGSIAAGNALIVRDIEVSNNTVQYSTNQNGINCNACSIVRGNLVRDIGQNGPSDLHAGYLISGTVEDVSGNSYIDDQQQYDAGAICSIPNALSTQCLASGRSRWILLKGGQWGFGWSNRTLFTGSRKLLIRGFVSNSVLELDDNTDVLPAGTEYHLYRTTFNAFELNGATIDRFSSNMALSTTGPFNHAAVQEDGSVRIDSLSGNTMHPYKCYGKCTNNYQGPLTTP